MQRYLLPSWEHSAHAYARDHSHVRLLVRWADRHGQSRWGAVWRSIASIETLNASEAAFHGRVPGADLGQQHLNLSVELLLAHPRIGLSV